MSDSRGTIGVLRGALLAGSFLTLCSCKVGPNFQRPPSSVADHWIGEPADAAPQVPDTAN